MAQTTKTNESAENYLKTILLLTKKKQYVHSIEIAHEMNFSKPSVSVAMKKLRQDGMITMDEYNHIHLTEEGRKVAETIYKRHEMIEHWLMQLGVSQETAHQDACKMEHVISDESFDAIREHAIIKSLSQVSDESTDSNSEE